ncbi:MAG TPA: hypothetical protein PKD05_15085 [Candidatus Melainabacteria bacterium]|nr:hypothetical protein [Candidatus Melainabacteria bacterium]
MTYKLYYYRGPRSLAQENDLIDTLSEEEFLLMLPALKALSNRGGVVFAGGEEIVFNQVSIDSLIDVIRDLIIHKNDAAEKAALERLNLLARQARQKELGIIFKGLS